MEQCVSCRRYRRSDLMHACNRGCSCRLVVLMYYILSTIMHYSIKTGSSLDISIWMTFKIPAWLTDIIFDPIAHFWKKLRSFFGYKVIMVQYLLTYLLTKYVFRSNPLYLLHKGIENVWEKGVFKFSNSPCVQILIIEIFNFFRNSIIFPDDFIT